MAGCEPTLSSRSVGGRHPRRTWSSQLFFPGLAINIGRLYVGWLSVRNSGAMGLFGVEVWAIRGFSTVGTLQRVQCMTSYRCPPMTHTETDAGLWRLLHSVIVINWCSTPTKEDTMTLGTYRTNRVLSICCPLRCLPINANIILVWSPFVFVSRV